MSLQKSAVTLSALLAFVFTPFANAQVVQLPSYRSFSYSGSAWVPDGGTADSSGVGYASRSSTSRGLGPYSSRAGGASTLAGSVTASVQIIDLQALDAALTGGKISSATPPVAQIGLVQANLSSKPSVASKADPASALASDEDFRNSELGSSQRLISVGGGGGVDHRSRDVVRPGDWQRALGGIGNGYRALDEAQAEADVRYYLQRGHKADKANSVLAARAYYKMAAEAMTPALRERYERAVAERKAEEERLKAERGTLVRRDF